FVEMRLGISGFERERLVDVGERVVVSSQFQENEAALGEPAAMVRRLREQPVERRKGVLEPILLQQRAGRNIEQIAIVCVDLQSLKAHRSRRFIASGPA